MEIIMVYYPVTDFTDTVDLDTSSDPIHNYPTGRYALQVKVFPETIAFPATAENLLSGTIALLIQNEGFEDLNIDGFIVSGDFAIVGTPPLFIAAGEAEGIQLQFAPKRAGAHTGSLYIDNDDLHGNRLVSLIGSGT